MRFRSFRLFSAAFWRQILVRLGWSKASAPALPPAGPPRVFIDALNLAHWRGRNPSLRVPLTLLAQLIADGREAVLYFDASTRYRLGDETALYQRLLAQEKYCVEVPSGKRADGLLLKAATACGGCVVSRDRYRHYRKKYRRLIDNPARLLQGGVKDDRLRVPGLSVDVALPATAEEAIAHLEQILDVETEDREQES